MRTFILILALAFVLCSFAWGRMHAVTSYPQPALAAATLPEENSKSEGSSSHIDFNTQIKPIFQAKCQPCHFSGGQMYERMPFDRPETIKTLGTKLLTRIKNENDQRLIRDFLAQ